MFVKSFVTAPRRRGVQSSGALDQRLENSVQRTSDLYSLLAVRSRFRLYSGTFSGGQTLSTVSYAVRSCYGIRPTRCRAGTLFIHIAPAIASASTIMAKVDGSGAPARSRIWGIHLRSRDDVAAGVDYFCHETNWRPLVKSPVTVGPGRAG